MAEKAMTMSPLDWVRFDTAGYEGPHVQEEDRVAAWVTPEGDEVRIFFVGMKPNLPADAKSDADFVAFYEEMLKGSGSRLVVAGVISARGVRAVRSIVSVPQEPSGRTYVASLIIPFRDFSYVLKCQCPERGITGMKEALLVDRSLAAGEVTFLDDGSYTIKDWMPDDPRHDAEFPDHPVARVRRLMDRVVGSLVVVEGVKAMPGFPLPGDGVGVDGSGGEDSRAGSEAVGSAQGRDGEAAKAPEPFDSGRASDTTGRKGWVSRLFGRR